MEKIFFEKKLEENNQLEFKCAKGGFPNSFWETYSAFSNTKGGIIYLGISEKNDKTINSSELTLDEAKKLITTLWTLVNNKQKVSENLLDEKNVQIKEFEGFPVVEVKVELAPKEYRPIYINNNILTGTYRRNHEGDYKCSPNEIKVMLRDADEKSLDLTVVEELGLDCLCKETINSYKNRFAFLHPEHIFIKEDEIKFLEYLGVVRVGKDKEYHPTRAGLLMFGYSYKIVYEFPEYFADYQEIDSTDLSIRWTDRFTTENGDWSGNLYDFYNKIINRLTIDIKQKFTLDHTTRIDENAMHLVLREALCNAISNADFLQPRGLVIKKYHDNVVFSNPGRLRIDLEKAIKGGESDARNKTILKIFNLVGIGERAGSGIPMILHSCKESNYKQPLLQEEFNPDRTKFTIYFIRENNTKVDTNTKPDTKPDTKLDTNTKINTKTLERRKAILDYLSENKNVKAKELAQVLNASVSSIKNDLYELIDNGSIVAQGTIKDKRYNIK